MRADVINVAADVSGIVVDVPVRDNQLVKKGDLLMQIDPDHYRIAMKQAESLVASRKATLEMRQLNARRRAEMDEMVVSRESRDDAHNTAAAAMADYEQAKAQLDAARLNLERTRVVAQVDGYVTNLNVHRGDYARVGEAKMAVIDKNSYWVYGYFEETKLPYIREGDPVDMQLMSGEHLRGPRGKRPRYLRPRQPGKPRADRRRQPHFQLGAPGPARAGAGTSTKCRTACCSRRGSPAR